MYLQSTIVLLIYLLSYRFNTYLPVFIFWIAVIAITCLICVQISLFNSNSNKYTILLQILIFSWIIRSLFIPNTGFFGHDPYKEMEVVYLILQNGWSFNSNAFVSYRYQYSYPILYVLIIVGSHILGLGVESIARWFPLIYSASSLLFIYLLSSYLFKSEKSALISTFGASMLYQFVMFHTLPIRESIAFVFFIAALFTYFKEQKSHMVFKILTLFFVAMIGLSHHMTSFLIIAFLMLHLIVDNICKILESKHINKLHIISDRKGFNISIYTFTLILGYWSYLRYSPLNIIAYAFEESAYTNPGHGMIVAQTLRFLVLVNGEYIFAFIFAALSIYSMILFKNIKSIYITFIIWVAIMGLMSILSLKGMVLKSESVAFASRFQSFGYISLFILSGSIIGINKQKGKILSAIKFVVISTYIVFILFSIYRIPINLYT